MSQSEREKYWLKMKEAKLESQRKLKAEKELEGCTFKPSLESNKFCTSVSNKSLLKELERNDSGKYAEIHSKRRSLNSRTSQSVPRTGLSREPEAESPELLGTAKTDSRGPAAFELLHRILLLRGLTTSQQQKFRSKSIKEYSGNSGLKRNLSRSCGFR